MAELQKQILLQNKEQQRSYESGHKHCSAGFIEYAREILQKKLQTNHVILQALHINIYLKL